MPLTPKLAFKLAFLDACLDQGRTLEEVREAARTAVEKTAGLSDLVTRPYNMAFDALSNLGSTGKSLGMIGLLAGPPAIGAGLGYGAAKLTDWDDMDAAEAKKRELIEQYQRFALQAKLNVAARQRRQAREPSFSRI